MAEEVKGDVIAPARLPDEPQPEAAPAEPATPTEEPGAPTTTDGDKTAADTTDEGEEGEEPAAPTKPKGVQKRLDELTRNWRETERDRDAWRDLALKKSEEKSPATEPAAPTPTDTLKPPVEADYEKFEDFQRALARYEVRQEFAAANERQLVADRAAAQARHAEAARAKFEEAATRYPDFHDVAMCDDVPISPAMASAMLDSPHAGDIAYFLGSHPKEAHRIAQLSPMAAARELGRIEDKFLNPVKPKTTTAPAPVKTVKSGDTPAKDPNKMSMAEYAAWRKASEPK